MFAIVILLNSSLLAFNLCLIERGSVFETDATGVSWISVAASLLSAGFIGYIIRVEMER